MNIIFYLKNWATTAALEKYTSVGSGKVALRILFIKWNWISDRQIEICAIGLRESVLTGGETIGLFALYS